MDRPRGRLKWATYLDQVASVFKDIKCRLPTLLSKLSWENRLQRVTEGLLQELQDPGLKNRTLAKKVQLCPSEATYLGYQLRGDKRSLSQSRVAAIFQNPKTQVPEFLGSTRYCCLWIPAFAEIGRPLYTSTKWDTGPLI